MNDYIYRIGSTTNVIGKPPRLYRSDELIKAGMAFGSVYAVTKEDAQAIEQAGTAAGFRGTVWSQRLWVDCDTEEASTQAQEFLAKEGYDHVIYTTGNRGCHIGILRSNAPSHTLPAQDKQWVRDNIPGADLGLYWALHLIRLPGALHSSTGLPKRLLREVKGRELTLPPYQPDEGVCEASAPQSQTTRQGIFKVWSVVSLLTDSGGSRHRHLVSLTKAIKEDGGLTYEECLWLVQEVNLGFDEPKETGEVQRIVNWAYGQT